MNRIFGVTPISLCAACLALSACMTTPQSASTSTAATAPLTFMTQQELLETLPGSAVAGISSEDNETRYTSRFSAGGTSGTTAGTWDGKPYASTWSVEGNRWCEQWDGGSDCWLMRRESETQIRAYRSETEPFRNAMTLQ